LQIARDVVADRLEDGRTHATHARTNEDRSSQIGDMGRGTRVRTYNFIHGIVSDERVKKKFRIDDVMKGNLGQIYKAFKKKGR